MSGPVIVIESDATVEEAGFKLAEQSLHRLVVVDDEGCATGVVSLLDVVRAMLSLPMRYSASFSHIDPTTGLVWTDDEPLDTKHVAHAPAGPGIIVVSFGEHGEVDRTILIDTSHSIRTRLARALDWPLGEGEDFARWMSDKGDRLRFRAAVVADKGARAEAVRQLRAAAG
jgi:CBS domain-containing protein